MTRRRPNRPSVVTEEGPVRVALYARVSTDEQRNKGTVENQLGKLRARAAAGTGRWCGSTWTMGSPAPWLSLIAPRVVASWKTEALASWMPW